MRGLQRAASVCAGMLVLALPTVALGDGAQSAILGMWLTEGASAVVRMEPCATNDRLVCGSISWLWHPLDDAGRSKVDSANPDAARRGRPLLGTEILSGFSAKSADHWTGGKIYNPEDGRTYDASIRVNGADTLSLEGCFLFICRKQLWRRAGSVCAVR